jgi:hypothetical protein
MLKRTLIAWCFAPVFLTGIAFAAQRYHSAGAAGRSVSTYSGEVNERTAARFVQLISHNVNRVIGLRVAVEPSSDSDFARSGYMADRDGPQFVISKSNLQNGSGIEVVTNGPVGRDAGMFILDGIYIVKAGGMHQGIESFGLQPVDEATVRLNPTVKIEERRF